MARALPQARARRDGAADGRLPRAARASRARRCSRSAAGWGRSTSSCCGAAPSAPSTSSSRPPTTPTRRGSPPRRACRTAWSGGCTTSPSSPTAIAPADVVVLHRVVCCYPDYERLLGAAAAHARRALVFSHPRRNLISRLVVGAENLGFRLMRREFRVFAHPPEAMLAVLRRAGLAARFAEQRLRVGGARRCTAAERLRAERRRSELLAHATTGATLCHVTGTRSA